uniref:Uncharacterized protein n=1 Tax=Gopherus agassizii TaxID=38772 RepID=A0A452I9X3_9SAUR
MKARQPLVDTGSSISSHFTSTTVSSARERLLWLIDLMEVGSFQWGGELRAVVSIVKGMGKYAGWEHNPIACCRRLMRLGALTLNSCSPIWCWFSLPLPPPTLSFSLASPSLPLVLGRQCLELQCRQGTDVFTAL